MTTATANRSKDPRAEKKASHGSWLSEERLWGGGAVVLAIVTWQIAAVVQNKRLLLPGPLDVLDAFVAHVEDIPGDSSISVTAMGGAIDRQDDDAAAFTGRGHPFDVSPDTAWSNPDLDAANMAWVRAAMAIVEPHLLPGRYINELSEAGPEVTRSSYGDAKLARLGALKHTWDPTNAFRLNHNIVPTPAD